MQASIVRASLVDQTYQAILTGICDGRFRPGERIRQEDLAAELGVSRQPIVQALGLLKAQGFLQPYRGKGLQVARLDPTLVSNLYEVRSALERVAVAHAAANPTAELRSEGEAAIADGRTAIRAGDAAGLIEADLRFHRALWQAAGNPLIGEVIEGYWAHLRWAMRNILEIEGYPEQVQDEHQGVLDAVCTGDPTTAETRLAEHLRTAAETVSRALRDDADRERAA